MSRLDVFASAESSILRVKSDLNRISRDSFRAYFSGKPDEGARMRMELIEKEMENIRMLISYVGTVSPAAARELMSRHEYASQHLRDMEAEGGRALEAWIKGELVPLLNQTEQAAYLVATTRRLGRNLQPRPFSWTMQSRR